MEFIRFKMLYLIFSLLMGVSYAQERFSPKSCLDSKFVMKMSHPGALFGVMKEDFEISKNGCILKVSHRKYFSKEWIIDVCREPVHLKITSVTGVEVAKKVGKCSGSNGLGKSSDFCAQYNELMSIIQDEGLIFAEGDRDDLTSNHGKTYCSYLLIDKYLKDGVVFSRFTEVPDIFLDKVKPIIEQAEATKEEIKDTEVKVEIKSEQVKQVSQ